jgi:hypothetical protein
MLSIPINVLAFRNVATCKKIVNNVATKIKDHVKSIIDHFSKSGLKGNIKACRVQAKKIATSLRRLSSFVLATGDGNESNETNGILRVQVTSGLWNESHPSIASLGNGKYFLAYESDESGVYGKEIFFTYSTDNGKSWSEVKYFGLEGNQTYPQVDFFERGNGIGTCLSDYIYYKDEETGYEYEDFNRSHVYLLEFSNPLDYRTWEVWFLGLWYLYDEEYGYEYKIENISAISLVLHGNNEGMISLVADAYNITSTRWEVVQGPIICHTNNYQGGYWDIIWFEEIKFPCSMVAETFDATNKGMFVTYQMKNNNSSKILCLYSKAGDVYNWTLHNLSMSGKNLTSPSVTMKDGKIYVAVESDDGVEKDIILYESSDGENWTSYNISARLSVSERYPVLYSNSTHLVCIYYNESKDIYLTTSTDGRNWSSVFDVNNGTGTVVDDSQTADIADSKHIVWTDSRSGNKDIWIAILGEKEEEKGKPKLGIVDIKLESGEDTSALNVINITYSNTGDKNATMVQLFITSLCIIDGEPTSVNITENPTYIPFIPKNTVNYIRLQWFTVEPLWKWILQYFMKEFLGRGEYPPIVEYRNITGIIVQLGPCLESNQSVTDSLPVTSEEIFGNLSWHPAIISTTTPKAGQIFNVTILSQNGEPVSNAVVIWPTTSTSLHILIRYFAIVPLTEIFIKILNSKIWKLPIKFRYKLILSLLVLLRPKVAVKTLTAIASFLASCIYIADQEGKIQLKAPSALTSMPLIVFSYKYRCFGIETVTVET